MSDDQIKKINEILGRYHYAIKGKTYGIKEELRQAGYRWNFESKQWEIKNVRDDDERIQQFKGMNGIWFERIY